MHTLPAHLRKIDPIPASLVVAMEALDAKLRNVQHLARLNSDATGAGLAHVVSVDSETLSHTMDFFADQMQDARSAIDAFIQSPPETQHAG